MNYYERHLGDYAKDTAHLTMIEHGAYSLLLDRYYGTESGIPADQAHRIARARTKEEKAAVDVVLAEFFLLVDGVWINKRAEEEIAKAQLKISTAKENGKKGGRPKKTKPPNETETQEKPDGLLVGSETETQSKAHQTPDTRHQSPLVNQEVIHTVSESESPLPEIPPDSAPEHPSTPAGEACLAIRAAGVQTTNPSHPTFIALLEAGADAEEFGFAAREAVAKGKANFAYVIGMVKKRREEAASLVLHRGRMPNKQEALEASNRSATAGWVPPELREGTA